MNVTGVHFTKEKWNPYLSLERRKMAEEKKQANDRQLLLCAEILLNRSLEIVCPGIALPVSYERNAHGKPYLLPPNEKIFVNWSHSGDYVLCAVSDREVGVDLQEIVREPGENLVRRALRPSERIFYEEADAQEKKRVFYEYWALKESFLKALGTGFQTSLEDFSIEMGASGPKILQKINEKKYQCRCLDFAEGNYTAAVCREGMEPLGKIEIEYLLGGHSYDRTDGDFEKMDR